MGTPGCAPKVLYQGADINIATNEGDLFLKAIGGILCCQIKFSG